MTAVCRNCGNTYRQYETGSSVAGTCPNCGRFQHFALIPKKTKIRETGPMVGVYIDVPTVTYGGMPAVRSIAVPFTKLDWAARTIRRVGLDFKLGMMVPASRAWWSV